MSPWIQEAPRRFQRALSVAVAFLRLAVVAQGFDLDRVVGIFLQLASLALESVPLRSSEPRGAMMELQ
tara:strand:- start:163 stop:366 length:204 start_codon:yes stop_codon:yes gene_type:complete